MLKPGTHAHSPSRKTNRRRRLKNNTEETKHQEEGERKREQRGSNATYLQSWRVKYFHDLNEEIKSTERHKIIEIKNNMIILKRRDPIRFPFR